MASKKTLNLENLKALGAEELAELLLDITKGDAAAKRVLRARLAGAASPNDLAAEIRKRLTAIGKAKSYIDWDKIKPFRKDLANQSDLILKKLAPKSPKLAAELIWTYLEIMPSVLARCDDGSVYDMCYELMAELPNVLQAAEATGEASADKIFNLVFQNDYAQFDDLIQHAAPALGEDGLLHLKEKLEAKKAGLKKPEKSSGVQKRAIRVGNRIGYAIGTSEEEHKYNSDEMVIRLTLKNIADALGDVDAYIDLNRAYIKDNPHVTLPIAQRLLAAERAQEALEYMEACDLKDRRYLPDGWERCRIDVLEALGKSGEAQSHRLKVFEESLRKDFLKDYLQRLPDFDDEEAETKALDKVLKHENFLAALHCLTQWPDASRASALVLARSSELNGQHYEYMSPAAELLDAKHPLAATLVLRGMIDFALKQSRVKRYKHIARHLDTCAELAQDISDFEDLETHAAYVDRLKRAYQMRNSFWDLCKINHWA